MKDCNISFQNKPALVISRIYKDSNRFHLPKISKPKSQSPNNIYYNEYFTEVRGIQAIPDKYKQKDKLLKYRFKELDLQKKQQKSLSTKHLMSEQSTKKDLQIEPYFVSQKPKTKPFITERFEHDLYQQSLIHQSQQKIIHREYRKPRIIFHEIKKEKQDKSSQVENELIFKDSEYDFWKYGYQEEEEDDNITDYVSGLL